MALLELENVDTYYGRVHALHGITLHIDEGEIVTLIGSNGAGKTTTLRTISGLTPAAKGQVRLRGKDITQEGTTILLIEQNAAKALAVANRGYVLETGRIVKEGPTSTLLESPDVQKAYLGI